MAELVLFHHALGLIEGMRAFADRLRSAGHHVTMPDLYGGATFNSVEKGVEHAERIGFDEIISRGQAAVAHLPAGLVYGGFSLGVLPAQKLAQTRPRAKAALLCHGGVPLSTFGGAWPDAVPLQIHAKEQDAWSEVDVLQELAKAVPGAELHLYSGSDHLFTDASLDAYDKEATDMVVERTLAMLSRLD